MKTLIVSIISVMTLILCFSACGTPTNDAPPWPDTPEPDPLSGVYSGQYGTLTFNGDGRSVTADFKGKAEEIIPDGEYSYVFLWNVGGEVRYDIASDFRLFRGDDYWQFGSYGGLPDTFEISYYYSNISQYEDVDLSMTFERLPEDGQTEREGQ
jgi:hypothetical protein